MTTSTLPSFLRQAGTKATAISFGVPVCAALLLGWYGAGFPTTGIGSSMAIAYWLAVLMPTWFAFEAASWAIAYVLRPLHPPFIAVIVLGCTLGGLAVRPFVVYIIGTILSTGSAGESPIDAPSFIWSVEWILDFVQEALVILLLWVGTNLLMHGPLALPRFGYGPSARPGTTADSSALGADSPASDPEFITRIKSISQDDITALEAEDHYVRVYSADASVFLGEQDSH